VESNERVKGTAKKIRIPKIERKRKSSMRENPRIGFIRIPLETSYLSGDQENYLLVNQIRTPGRAMPMRAKIPIINCAR